MKFAKGEDLKCYHHTHTKHGNLCEMVNILVDYGSHFTMCTYIKSSHHISLTYKILFYMQQKRKNSYQEEFGARCKWDNRDVIGSMLLLLLLLQVSSVDREYISGEKRGLKGEQKDQRIPWWLTW